MLAARHRFALPQLGLGLLAPNPAPLTLLLCPAAKVSVIDAKHGLILQKVSRAKSNMLHFQGTTHPNLKEVPASKHMASKQIDCVCKHLA